MEIVCDANARLDFNEKKLIKASFKEKVNLPIDHFN